MKYYHPQLLVVQKKSGFVRGYSVALKNSGDLVRVKLD